MSHVCVVSVVRPLHRGVVHRVGVRVKTEREPTPGAGPTTRATFFSHSDFHTILLEEYVFLAKGGFRT